LLHLTSDF